MTQDDWLKLGDKWETTKSKRVILYPSLGKILGDVKGRKILDAGCGDGFGVRWLREKGAECVGIDIVSEQIESCKKKDPEGRYYVDDVKNLKINGKFDYVLSIMVLLSFDKKEDIVKAIKSMCSKLSDDGKLIIFTTHPAFDYTSENMESMMRSYSDKYSYAKKGLPTLYKHKTQGYTLNDFHWMIEDYAECIKESKLVIENIFEPMPIPESEKDNPEVFRARINYPFYMAFVCKR